MHKAQYIYAPSAPPRHTDYSEHGAKHVEYGKVKKVQPTPGKRKNPKKQLITTSAGLPWKTETTATVSKTLIVTIWDQEQV